MSGRFRYEVVTRRGRMRRVPFWIWRHMPPAKKRMVVR